MSNDFEIEVYAVCTRQEIQLLLQAGANRVYSLEDFMEPWDWVLTARCATPDEEPGTWSSTELLIRTSLGIRDELKQPQPTDGVELLLWDHDDILFFEPHALATHCQTSLRPVAALIYCDIKPGVLSWMREGLENDWGDLRFDELESLLTLPQLALGASWSKEDLQWLSERQVRLRSLAFCYLSDEKKGPPFFNFGSGFEETLDGVRLARQLLVR